MAKQINIDWQSGRAWRAESRGHEVVGDSRREEGGQDLGMTPGELMVASMGLCTGIDLSYWSERHPGLDLSRVRIELSWEDAPDKPWRVGVIQMRVILPDGLTDAERATLTRIANGCKVHNTLERGVVILVSVE